MIFPRISNLFYVSYFREKSLIYDLRVSENSTYVTRSIKPRMYVHGILTPPDNLQMQLHVGSPKNWQVLDLIILYKHVHINIYICTINNISTSPTNRGYEIIFYCYCIALIVQSILTITFVALEEKYIYGTVRLSLFFPCVHVEKMH